MTLRVLVVDDESLARRALRQLLASHPDVEVVAECADAVSARDVLARDEVDLILLDIRMPEVSGLELAAERSGPAPYVVFVTAHEQFGVPAFQVEAADYLLKPITQDRLDAALDRVRARIATDRDAARFRQGRSGGSPTPPAAAYLEHLVTRVGNRDLIIRVEDIELISAADVYAAVHAGGRRYLVRTALDELERGLDPARFSRVHRSYIVPLGDVVALRRQDGGQVLELRNGATVPVSRRRRHQLRRLRRKD